MSHRLKLRGRAWWGAATLSVAASLAAVVTLNTAAQQSGVESLATPSVVSESAASSSLRGETSAEVQHLLKWIVDTQDNAQVDFVMIDKKQTTAHIFDASGRWVASSPVLIGLALGDDSAPDIGTRPLAMVKANERTTPAGRFKAELGSNTDGETVVWVDYDAAVSMHSVRTNNPSEQRLQRLASTQVAAHRISYGCINFPDAFFKTQVLPRFTHQNAVVYVLPDLKSIASVFGSDAKTHVQHSADARSVARKNEPRQSF